jgi:serine phosphatase RsbU (regulator of sigma subunit)
MTALSRLLDQGALERLVNWLHDLTGSTVAVEAADGSLLAGTRPPTGAVRTPISVDGEEVGTVVGDRVASGVIAEVLADRAAREIELTTIADELLDRYEEATLLYDLSQTLGSVFDVPTACTLALQKARAVIPARSSVVVLTRADGSLEVAAGTPLAGDEVSARVAATGTEALLHAGEDADEAFLSVPLAVSRDADAQVLGALTLAGRDTRFSAGEAKLANAIASQLATAIRSSRLVDSLRSAERVQREVEIAATIQRSLLPAAPPQLARVALAGRCEPAAVVGGDYYDFIVDTEGRLSLLIADVAGHSIGSALMMAMARSVLRREVEDGKPPSDVLAATNRSLFDDLVNAGLFITAFCARYDPATNTLAYSNAGHNPPFLRCGSEVLELDTDGAALGILRDVDFEEQRVQLAAGDVLLLYTDGVVEALDAAGAAWGEDRLRAAVAEADGAAALTDAVYERVRAHVGAAQQDDVTLVALEAV